MLRVVEGTVYLGLLNGAGAAPLSGDAEGISYGLVSGLSWETEQIALPDLAQGTLFGFRTTDERVGYAHVDDVLDQARTFPTDRVVPVSRNEASMLTRSRYARHFIVSDEESAHRGIFVAGDRDSDCCSGA